MLGPVDRCLQRLALAAVLCASTTAAADGLTWTAPAGCPDTTELRANVERRLEHSLAEVALAVDVRVTWTRTGYLAEITAAGEPARTLASRHCRELADAVAIVVARVAADAIAEADAIEIDPPALPARVATRDPDEPLADRVAALPALTSAYVPRPWTISARMSGVSGIGVIPRVGLAGELAVSVRAGDHLAELGASRWVASASQFHAGASSAMDINLDTTIGRYGWRPPVLPLRAWGAVEVGTMHAGAGIVIPGTQKDSSRWLAIGSGFGIAWQIRPWIRLVGATEVMVAVRRARFATGNMDLYAPAPMSVRTVCGLEVGWQ